MGERGQIAARISTIASRQYGHVTRGQLRELGVPERTISYWIASGRLTPVHAGVYAVDYVRPEPIARAAAAVLACGPGAALSHESAAVLWGLARSWPERPEVTVVGDRRRPGIAVHRTSTLRSADIRRHLGIRVTSPARTVVEIAPRLTRPALTRAVNDARLSGYLHLSDLEELLVRLPTHPGTRLVGEILETGNGPTRSGFEDAFVAFARRAGLPSPRINARVAGYEVDALFGQERVIVELDGYEFHRGRRAFERDRERDAATLAAGFQTVRMTWTRLNDQAQAEARRLQGILLSRRGPP